MNDEPTSVERLIAKTLEIDPSLVTDDLSYGDVNQWDSLSHVNLMLELEAAYNVAIDEDTMIELISVKAIKEYVRSRG